MRLMTKPNHVNSHISCSNVYINACCLHLTGTRYKPTYDFGFVTLDIMWVYEWDSGVYECRATNDYGTAATSATITVSPLRSIVLDTQLPGDGAVRLEAMEEHWKSHMDLDMKRPESPQQKSPPRFDLLPEAVETAEGEPAKFLVKVSGFPRPKVSWWINGMLMATVSIFFPYIYRYNFKCMTRVFTNRQMS